MLTEDITVEELAAVRYEEGWEDGREEGRKAGHAEGHAEGLKEKELEIARNLKKLGLPVSQIAEGTGLPPEAVEKL